MSFASMSPRPARLRGPLASIILTLLCLIAGLQLVRSPLSAQTGGPLPIISVSGSSGLVLTPQTPTTLTVQVTDRAGAPLAGVNVIFIAPPSGATGSFQNATPDGATFLRASTDANGQAGVMFVPNNTPGVYLVEAGIEDTPAATSFAITTLIPDSVPALSPDDARSAVKQQFLANVVEDELVRLHGPVLLPAGTVLSTVEPLSKSFTTTSTSWFFWLDRFPSAKFAHPGSFIVLDAGNPTPDFTAAPVTAASYWPIVALPGADCPIALLPPSRTNSTLTAPAAPAASGAGKIKAGLGVIPYADSCAIVIRLRRT